MSGSFGSGQVKEEEERNTVVEPEAYFRVCGREVIEKGKMLVHWSIGGEEDREKMELPMRGGGCRSCIRDMDSSEL